MQLLQDLDKSQLSQYLENFGCRSYAADQIYAWLCKGVDFDGMTNISLSLREKLKQNAVAQSVKIEKVLTSSDGTQKFLFRLFDGNLIEGVLMKYKYGNTLCVSTQVGCRMGCKFCASTLEGRVRNLSSGEILGQVVAVNALGGGNRYVTNVVLMGSGEPLDNFDNVTKFIRLLSSPDGLNVSQRNVSLSTCGLVPEMRQLADSGLNVTLTVSLHSAIDEKRRRMMPIANKYSVSEVTEAARYYFEKTGRRVIFEYTLISGFNDGYGDAVALAHALRNFPTHVNVIRLNPVKETGLKESPRAATEKFIGYLEKLKVSATVRRRMGDDIEGACGQLRRKHLSGEEV